MTPQLDRVKETTATTGTGTVNLSGTAVAPYQTWANGGAVTATTYFYLIEQGADSEWGFGTFTSGSPNTFSRDTVLGSIIGGVSGTSKINLTGSGTIACVLPAEYFSGKAPTYRGSTWSGAITGTSATLALPAGSLAGDLIVSFGAGGNFASMAGSGWTSVFAGADWWAVYVYSKTLTSGDISTGSVTVNVSGSFVNYQAISVFAAGAYIASLGYGQLSFMNSGVTNLPQDPALMPQVGKVDINPNMSWLLMGSCRGLNASQGLTAYSNGSVLSTIGSGTNGNGSAAAWTANWGANLPIARINHGGNAQIGQGNLMIGVLNGTP